MAAISHDTGHDLTTRELQVLLELTRRLAKVDDIESVLEAVAAVFRPLVPFERIEYSIPDGEKTMQVTWVWTSDTPLVFEIGERLPHGYPDSGEMDPELIPDLEDYIETTPEDHSVARLVAAGYRATIACPLVVDDRLEGIVFFNTTHAGAWNLRHRTLVELITEHLAIAAARVRLTAELKETNRHLVELHAARTRFLAAVSHEIRSPLTAVVGISQILAEGVDHLRPNEISELAAMLDQQVRDVTDLADDLLVASRFDAGGMRVDPTEVDLSEAVIQAISSVGASFSPSFTPVAGSVVADPLRLRQILRNLLTNALRHGGPKMEITARRRDTWFEVDVRDDGPGFPEGIDPFEPFALSDKPHAESVGLGLAVSRSLAEAMGGSLDYRRRDGWTVLTLRLPAT
ncbi:MAG: ATP-binding protein [Acidimicrobiia bacterium]